MKKLYTTILMSAMFCAVNAQSWLEEFDSIATNIPAGWDTIQMSSARDTGSTSWFAGSMDPTPFITPLSPYSGTDFIGASWQSTSTLDTGTISNWLIAPQGMLNNGDVLIFNTTTINMGSGWPDRLQIRVSQNGASSNVGSDENSVGDFQTLVYDINPTYILTGSPGGYPETWTRFVVTLSGLPVGGVSGRIAFRYYCVDAGLNGTNSFYVALDSVYYESVLSSIHEDNQQQPTFSVFPNPAQGQANLAFADGNTETRTVIVTNMLGEAIYTEQSAAATMSIDLSQFTAGIYSVSVTDSKGTSSSRLVVR